MILYLGGILILHFILLLKYTHSVMHAWNIDFPVNSSLCTTKECINHGAYIADLLNFNVNPCHDFYDFVCSKWQETNPIPALYPEWKTSSAVEEVAFERMKKILEEKSSKHDRPALAKAKNIYEECTDIPDLGIIDAATMRPHIEAAGHFPLLCSPDEASCYEKSWIQVHNYYLSITGESALFDIYAHADIRNNLDSLLHISEIVSPYGLIKLTKRMLAKKEPIYRLFLATAVNRLISAKEHKLSSMIIEKRLKDVFHFRDSLLSILSHTHTNVYNVMSVKEFAHWYHEGVKHEGVKAQISWIDVISALYNNKKSLSTIKNMKINVKHKSYFGALAHLLSKTHNDVVVNHIHLYFIERHLELDSYLYQILLDAIVQDGKLLAHVDYSGKRWQACITCNTMREAITKVYAEKYFPSSTKNKIMSMIKNMRKIISIKIADCDWLDDAAREEATYLIDNLQVTIDSECESDVKEQPEYSMNTCKSTEILDIFYSPVSHCISISSAYFQPPLYSPKLPHSVTYGSIGSIFGHEMLHAFDPLFTKYSSSPRKFCCSGKILSAYGTKAKCFVKQYDKIPVKELERIDPIPKTDGNKMLNENIADTMGVKFAYEMFRKKMWETGYCETLPKLPHVNCEQLFFISFALSHCGSAKADKILEDLETGEHSTPRLRVNGAVSNMKEFSKVFHCFNNEPMNARHKCSLFE